MRGKICGILQAILTALVILSGGIALPILFRPFYYWHIEPLALHSKVNLTAEHVKAAYNGMLDFCIGKTDTFSAGVLEFSESGAAHFADVRILFLLDLGAFFGAAILLMGLLLLKGKKTRLLRGHTPGFWSAVGLGIVAMFVGVVAAMDFDGAFTVFHKLVFPGKSNWIFDPVRDPVIRLLPEIFFRNCAVLIVGVVLVSCGALLLWDRRIRYKKR